MKKANVIVVVKIEFYRANIFTTILNATVAVVILTLKLLNTVSNVIQDRHAESG